MNQVVLKKLFIKNLGPIKENEVNLEAFTYFVGRNNAGKSHFLKAIALLLASRAPDSEEICKLQNDKAVPIEIRGYFEGVGNFTSLVSQSKHKEAIERKIKNGILVVGRNLDSTDKEKTVFGIPEDDGSIVNITGFPANLLKVLPEPIEIIATADTVDELKNKSNTALDKLKKEVLRTFFESLKEETKKALVGIDKFLHSSETGQRSADLINFEGYLKEELMGEFTDIKPSIEFGLPDEEVIAKEMKVFLDDGHRSEIEQKGHGLQRAALLAMLRVLAKHGLRYQDKPAPIFLIGEIETFLHPYAQKLLAEALDSLVDRYQIITSTHSPFIIAPLRISGYRRVVKKHAEGTKNIALKNPEEIEIPLITRHLERRGNLEGLFADRVILIEGSHDEGFYHKLRGIFNIPLPANKFTLFVKACGRKEVKNTRKFYKVMGFDDVAIICDVDNLFSNDGKNLLKEAGIEEKYIDEFRTHIGWTTVGDPPLKTVAEALKTKGEPKNFESVLLALSKDRIFVLRKGAPEDYYKNSAGEKDGWEKIASADDLNEPEYLKALMTQVLK